jgi:hypothetical protein
VSRGQVGPSAGAATGGSRRRGGPMPRDVAAIGCLGPCRLCLTVGDGVAGEVGVTRLVPFEGVLAPLRDPRASVPRAWSRTRGRSYGRAAPTRPGRAHAEVTPAWPSSGGYRAGAPPECWLAAAGDLRGRSGPTRRWAAARLAVERAPCLSVSAAARGKCVSLTGKATAEALAELEGFAMPPRRRHRAITAAVAEAPDAAPAVLPPSWRAGSRQNGCLDPFGVARGCGAGSGCRRRASPSNSARRLRRCGVCRACPPPRHRTACGLNAFKRSG